MNERSCVCGHIYEAHHHRDGCTGWLEKRCECCAYVQYCGHQHCSCVDILNERMEYMARRDKELYSRNRELERDLLDARAQVVVRSLPEKSGWGAFWELVLMALAVVVFSLPAQLVLWFFFR